MSRLGWLVESGEAESLVEAAYRYAAYTEGVSTVMTGTIDPATWSRTPSRC